jgi:subtilase family serine protease
MFKPSVKKSAFLTACFLLLSLMLTIYPASAAQAKAGRTAVGNRAAVAGTTPSAANRGQLVSRHASSDVVSAQVSLNIRNQDQLDRLLADQVNPQSPLYKHYLTSEQYRAMFAPTADDVAKVTSFLNSNGLNVSSVNAEHTLINFSGPAANVEQAFGTTLNDYKDNQGNVYYAHATELSVPSYLSGLVLNVTANNAPHWHSKAERVQPHLGSGPAGGYTPTELRNAYDVNPLISGGYNGTGQTVALFELDSYAASNISKYVTNYSLGSPAPTNVYVDGASSTPGQGQVEVELDIEVVNAIAPKANTKVYIGPNTDAGVNDTYQRIATDNIAKVTSSSWGLCELDSAASSMNTLDTIFKQYAAQGQSIFSAAGDAGAYDCQDKTTTLAVDSPSNDPYVTGVGGTYLTLSGSSYGSERVWGTTKANGGGGGGVSTIYSKPSYQTGPGTTSFTGRGVPDVSADADPASGYSIYSQGSWTVVGGTSAAAPLWAGLAALNNQYAAANGKGNLGQANIALYKAFNTTQTYPAYHDITSGSNFYYNAAAGYDLASGIGTPDAYNLIRDINGSTTGGGGGGTGGGGSTQLINNGGFESGNTGWTESSSGGYEIVDSSTSSLHHGGSASAWIDGYNSATDSIYQTISIPSTATSVQLSFYVYVSTQESGSTAYDKFTAAIRNTSGTTLATVKSLSNATASGWVQYTYDLTSYKGQSVQVYFKGTTDSSLPTNFFLDDVSVISQ